MTVVAVQRNMLPCPVVYLVAEGNGYRWKRGDFAREGRDQLMSFGPLMSLVGSNG